MSIKYLAIDERPREKFLQKGKNALSDAELLAIIMGSGSKEESAVDLARRVLKSVDNSWAKLSLLSVKDLTKFKGIGQVKAITICTALEIARRKSSEKIPVNPTVKSSQDAFKVLHPLLGDLRHEEFWCLLLNQSNRVIHKEKLTQGGIDQSIADVRVLFNIALSHFATAIIIAHNHPSGNFKPSSQDIDITKKIRDAGEILNIRILDHLIISQDSFLSFADEGIL